jgi:hypothetical protein
VSKGFGRRGCGFAKVWLHSKVRCKSEQNTLLKGASPMSPARSPNMVARGDPAIDSVKTGAKILPMQPSQNAVNAEASSSSTISSIKFMIWVSGICLWQLVFADCKSDPCRDQAFVQGRGEAPWILCTCRLNPSRPKEAMPVVMW